MTVVCEHVRNWSAAMPKAEEEKVWECKVPEEEVSEEGEEANESLMK